MFDKTTDMMPNTRTTPAAGSGANKAVTPMMSPTDFTGIGKSAATLMEAVVQTNLRITQELLRANSPKAVLELQRRFVQEYMAVLMQGTLTLVGAIEPAAAD